MENRAPLVEPLWVLAVGGVVSILFGILALVWPGLTLIVLAWLYGIFALVYGVVQLIAMFRAIGEHTTWWTHLLLAAISIIAGIFVLSSPLISTLVLAVVIGIWAIATGIVEVISGVRRAHFLGVAVGVITVLFGLIMFANPAAGALALVWVIGVFAIVHGIMMLFEAFMAPAVGPTQP